MQRVSGRRGGAWPARRPWSQEGGAGSDGRKMAALKEGRSYGLSCGRVSDGSKVSVFHVKLTDSALRAFESYRASQVSSADPARRSGKSGRRPASRAPRLAFRRGGAGSGVRGAARGSLAQRGTIFIIGAGRRHWRAARGSNSRAWSWGRPGPFPAHSAPGQDLVCSVHLVGGRRLGGLGASPPGSLAGWVSRDR